MMPSLLELAATAGGVFLVLIAIIQIAPKGWRTLAVQATAGIPVLGTIVAQLNGFDWASIGLTPAHAATAGLVVLVVNAGLRAVTTTTVGKSG